MIREKLKVKSLCRFWMLLGALETSHSKYWIKLRMTPLEVTYPIYINIPIIELSAEITVSDINPDMLEVGKKRAVERGIFHGEFYLFRKTILL